MTFQRAPIIRPTPGFNFCYNYFWHLVVEMQEFYDVDWFYIKKGVDKNKHDLIATYNMGQEL